jgi:uncharacterized protein YjbI with pentapeptide repeats
VLKDAALSGATAATAELRGADLTGLRGWDTLANVSYLNISNVRHAPPGFRTWALESGAVEGDSQPIGGPVMEPSFSQEWRSG